MNRIILVCVLSCLALSGCQYYEEIITPTDESIEQQEPAFSWDFPGVAQEVIEAARSSYGDNGAPAVVIRVHESDNPKEGHRMLITADLPDCEFVDSQRSTDKAGFVFLNAEDLCGEGTYLLDLRQGGIYDTLCGPDSDSFIYEGSPVWMDVDVWCE